MNRQQAQRIIQETFENPFEKDRFANFVRNLLNKAEDAPFTYHGNLIPDSYKPFISKYERTGKYHDGENRIDVLIVHLNREKSIERARSMQRNFVAGYLQGRYGSSQEKDAAIVAFVAPDEADWRFSLVKMDYRFEEGKNGKIKVKEEFTPARRWSFLVGCHEASHTAQSRLVNLLADDEHNPTLEQLEEAFNIETVTKEFFLKYRDLFIRTKEELDKVIEKSPKIKADLNAKAVNTVDFAKKLLGQIVFLYFLQKKGWFGVDRDGDWGTGSKQFLRELFERKHGDYKNFFNDILEPLFYEALRIDRSHDDHYYSRFDCKIPFLNGGLFDPIGNYDWVHTDICLPDSLFSNKTKTKEGDLGDGILDVFDRYNFTVKEDEPLEKEVAIDPELLGKAYEKFNAIRPDNFEQYKKALKSGKKGEESKFNKQYGVYYTPREIVHYMCQQSLIQYLHTELNSGRVNYERLGEPNLDMFGNEAQVGQQELTIEHRENPVFAKADIEQLIHFGELMRENEAHIASLGKETKTYPHRLAESIRRHADLVDRKLMEITVCDPAVGSGAFPVGMMTEIVKARNVLSAFTVTPASRLSHKQDAGATEQTLYLFKRHCIEHCLYGVDIDPGAVEIAKLRLWLSLVVDEEDIYHIKPLPNLDYKIMCGNSLLGLPDFAMKDLQLESEIEQLKLKYFNETNPTNKKLIRDRVDQTFKKLVQSAREYSSAILEANFDFKICFSEVFHKKDGFDVVIGNPPYLNVELVPKEQKEHFTQRYKTFFKRFDVFGLFFELALTNLISKKGAVTFIIPQQIFNNLSYKRLRDLMLNNRWLNEVLYLGDKVFEANNDVCILFLTRPRSQKIRLINALDFNNRIITEVPVDHFQKYGNVISFSYDSGGEIIFDKIFDAKHERIKERFDVFQGIVTGNNTAFLPTKEQIRHAKIEESLLHPVLLGRDFEKWLIRSTERCIIYVDGGTNIKEYPHSERWLSQFRSELKKRRECQRGIIPWYSLQWPRVKAQLDRVPKILVQRTRNPRLKTRVVAMIDEVGFYGMESIIFIIPKTDDAPMYYLLAVLNSNLVNYLYATKFLNVAIKAEYLKDTPIPKTTTTHEKELTDLVKKILAAKKRDPNANITELEREIDQMVYRLYGLTEEEIRIVEGKK